LLEQQFKTNSDVLSHKEDKMQFIVQSSTTSTRKVYTVNQVNKFKQHLWRLQKIKDNSSFNQVKQVREKFIPSIKSTNSNSICGGYS